MSDQAVCVACGRDRHLRKDGRFRLHCRLDGLEYCPGSDLPPAEVARLVAAVKGRGLGSRDEG